MPRSARAVCIDRNGAYRSILQERLPRAEVVHERFHIMANLNAALDEVRRSEWRAAKGEGKQVIKGSRFLLVAVCENPSDDGAARLAELTVLDGNLSAAYVLKEKFRDIYPRAVSTRSATPRLKRWCDTVFASGIGTAVPLCQRHGA